MEPDEGPQVPADLNSERAWIGGALLSNAVLKNSSIQLEPEHFYEPLHGLLYETICDLLNRGQEANPLTIDQRLRDVEIYQRVGGLPYVTLLADETPALYNLESYAKVIYDCWRRRQILSIAEGARDGQADTDELLNAAAEKLLGLYLPKNVASTRSVAELHDAVFQHMQQGDTGLLTGVAELDDMGLRLRPETLWIVAGRSSMGKTALGLHVALKAAVAGKKTLIISAEMSGEMIDHRLLSWWALSQGERFPYEAMAHAGRAEGARDRLLNWAQQSADLPLLVDDESGLSLQKIRGLVRRAQKRLGGLDLVVVDYLQRLQPPRDIGGNFRERQIAALAEGLKEMARETELPVLALSQLSRAPETREDPRPKLSDLRESGTIENEADVVLGLYREEYYLRRAEPPPHEFEKIDAWHQKMAEVRDKADILVLKNRMGKTGNVRLHCDIAHGWFGGLSDG